ncbi:hypothetical protein AAC387_Pa06g1262 [Persea americana]
MKNLTCGSEVEVEYNTSDGNANADMGETNLNVGNPVRRPSSESQQFASVDPYVGMELDSDEAAKSFYNRYARRTGFSTCTSLRKEKRKPPKKREKRWEKEWENGGNEVSGD